MEFNNSIFQAAKECIPKGARKDYKPYWSEELKKSNDALTEARENANKYPGQENNMKLKECAAEHLRTKIASQRAGWRKKLASLILVKDTSKV